MFKTGYTTWKHAQGAVKVQNRKQRNNFDNFFNIMHWAKKFLYLATWNCTTFVDHAIRLLNTFIWNLHENHHLLSRYKILFLKMNLIVIIINSPGWLVSAIRFFLSITNKMWLTTWHCASRKITCCTYNYETLKEKSFFLFFFGTI